VKHRTSLWGRSCVALVVAGFSVLGAREAHAQQNFFNVPASEVTPKGEVFFQAQVNLLSYLGKWQSNNHFCFGLGHDFELGFNVSHLNVYLLDRKKPSGFSINARDPSQPLNPVLVVTAQKSFEFGHHFGAALGTQTGVNFGGPLDTTRGVSLTYANVYAYSHEEHVRVLAGIYYGNRPYLGGEAALGVWAGFEAQLVKNLNLIGDVISGSHEFANAVIGFNWYFHPKTSLVFGPILPMPGSDNDAGYVVELNVLDVGSRFR
jgi:hypothetical protein